MKTFKDLLFEMSPVAMSGDWEEGYENTKTRSKFVIKKNFELVEKFDKFLEENDFYLYKMTNSLYFVFGKHEENGDFYPHMSIDFTRIKTLDKDLNIKKIIKVNGVVSIRKQHGQGIASTVYKYIVNDLGYNILSDDKQYFGARRLWSKLSDSLDVVVDVVDVDNKKVIEKNVKLKKEDFEGDFDSNYWSKDSSKKNIRFLLKKVIDK